MTRVAYLTQNAGVARGWNIGAHMALGEFLVFVNEDVVVGPGCIDGLVWCLQARPAIGMVGPRGRPLGVHCRPRASPRVRVRRRGGPVRRGFRLSLRDAARGAGRGRDVRRRVRAGVVRGNRRRLGCPANGRKVCALGGLQFDHDWGVSAWDPERPIEWLGRVETTGAISLRNQARLIRKWGGGARDRAFDGRYYDAGYFERGAYLETMTKPRVIDGRTEPPLVQTMADVIESTGLVPPGGSVLDVGCSYGLLVKELVSRGYDARGVDFSVDAVAASPVRDRIWQGNALEMPVDRRYDAVFAGDIFEHLNDAEARILTRRILSVSDVLLAIINKSRHEASHVNIKSNRRWLALFADCGLGFEAAATWRGRRRYLAQSAGTECWHENLLALSRRRHTALRRVVTRVAGDGTLAWWVAGRMGFLWR